jgi:hypothetical protein
MRSSNLTNKTTEDLVALFIRIALEQDEAVCSDDNATFNRLFKQMDAVRLNKQPSRRPTEGVDEAV